MPLTYEVEPDTGIVHSRGSGTLTRADVIGHATALADDATVPLPVRDLHDLMAVERWDIGPSVLWELGRITASRRSDLGPGRVAMVTASGLATGFGRMLHLIVTSMAAFSDAEPQPQVRFFSTRAEALDWLTRSQPDVPAGKQAASARRRP